MIITIDGPSGTGKSSVARLLAKRLGFLLVDTGALYRAFAYWVLKHGVDPNAMDSVCQQIASFPLRVVEEGTQKRYWLDKEEVTELIRLPEVTRASSVVAAYPEVRCAMMKRQHEAAAGQDAVFEGRDLGTVVFPGAELKFYLMARPEVRAKRRHAELIARDPTLADTLTVEAVVRDQESRDRDDSTRRHSPLRAPKDAHVIDTSDLSLEEVVEKLVAIAKRRGS